MNKFLTIPKKFITDFFIISKESYDDASIIIDFDKICLWMDIRKDHLKDILIDNFEENYDYTIEKVRKTLPRGNATVYHDIKVTPNCFKELCMISQSPKAKEVRKYFIEMERLIKRYYVDIKESMYAQNYYFEPMLIKNR